MEGRKMNGWELEMVSNSLSGCSSSYSPSCLLKGPYVLVYHFLADRDIDILLIPLYIFLLTDKHACERTVKQGLTSIQQ